MEKRPAGRGLFYHSLFCYLIRLSLPATLAAVLTSEVCQHEEA